MPRCVIFPTMGRHHPYTAALVQMAMGDDPADNLARAVGFVEEAASRGARLVCLPELFRCRYFCQTEDAAAFSLAESARDGPTRRMLGEAARRLGVVVVAPLFEERGPGLYHNSALVIEGDGSVAGLYRKMHVPDDPGYMEKYYFAPGDLGFPVHSTRLGRVGVLICWDQWYPEAARIAALRGAHVLFYPTAIGWHPREKERCGRRQLEAWRAVQRGHAVANAFYVAAVNRVVSGRTPPLKARGRRRGAG